MGKHKFTHRGIKRAIVIRVQTPKLFLKPLFIRKASPQFPVNPGSLIAIESIRQHRLISHQPDIAHSPPGIFLFQPPKISRDIQPRFHARNKIIQITGSRLLMQDRSIRTDNNKRRVSSNPEFLIKFHIFIFRHIILHANETGIKIISRLFPGKHLCQHPMARATPGSITIYKHQFIFSFRLFQRLLERNIPKIHSLLSDRHTLYK